MLRKATYLLGIFTILFVPLAYADSNSNSIQHDDQVKAQAEAAKAVADAEAAKANAQAAQAKAEKAKIELQKAKKKTAPIDSSPWNGSNAGLGINITTGNTNTSNYNTTLNVIYSKVRWTNTFNGSYQRGRSNGVLNKSVYSLQEQLQYSLNKEKKIDNYIFFASISKMDEFSPFKYQCTNTAGYGRDWVKNDNFSFSSQVGPGYRRNKDDRGTVRQSVIAFIQTNLMWKVTNSNTLTQSFQDTYGAQYNYLQSTTSLTNKLIGNLAVQMQYTINYYSTIPANSSNTRKVDTTLNINILYNF